MKVKTGLSIITGCVLGAGIAMVAIDLLSETPCSCTEGCVVKVFETATCVFCPTELACCTVRGKAP